jgi:hypothetical protein
MKTASVSTDLYSQQEKQVSRSILKFGKYGLRKLNTSLAKFGFSIRE